MVNLHLEVISMNYVSLSAKLPSQHVKLLKSLSERTKIPQSELIREGIQLVIQRYKEDAITPEIRNEIDRLLREDKKLLQRLARS